MKKNPKKYMASKFRRKRVRRRLKNVVVLPTFVTLLNALFGFSSILFAARGTCESSTSAGSSSKVLVYFAVSAWMIVMAMVADGLDGFVARKSGGTSFFGGQLDSLSDAISFGAAPAFLMLQVVESALQEMVRPISPFFSNFGGRLLWIAGAIYVACALLRLARFNVENRPDESAHMSFRGLPSPAAAAVITSLVLLYCEIGSEWQKELPTISRAGLNIIIYSLPFITVVLGLAMVSQIAYVHVINRYIRGRKSFRKFIMLLFIALGLILKLQLTLALASVIYLLSGPSDWLWRRRGKVKPTAILPKPPSGPPPENRQQAGPS